MLSALGGESMPAQSWSNPFQHNQPHAGTGGFTSPYSPWSLLPGSNAPAPSSIFTAPATVPAQVAWSGGGVFVKGWPQPEPLHNGRSFNAVHMALIPKGPYRGHVLVWNHVECYALVNPPGVPPLSTPQPGEIVTQGYQAYAIVDPADAPLHGIRYRNFLVPTGDELRLPESWPVIAKNMFCAGHAWSPYGDLIVPGATEFELVIPPPPAAPSVAYGGGSLVYVFNPRRTCQWPGTPTEYYPSTVAAGSPSADDYRGLWARAADLAVPRWYPTATLTHRLLRQAIHPQTGPIPGTANRERMVFLGGSVTVPALPGDHANFSYEAYVILGECDNQPPNRSKLVPDYASGPAPFVPTSLQQDRIWNGPGISPVLGSLPQDWLYEYPRTFLLSSGELFFSGYAPRGAWLEHDGAPGLWAQAAAQPGAPGTYSSNWPEIRHDGSAVLFPNLGGNADVVLRLGGAKGHGGAATDTMESIAAGSTASTWTAAPSMPSEDVSIDGGRLFANTVILPTGGLLILGGLWQDGGGAEQPLYHPLLFEGGQWHKMRVFLGGGPSEPIWVVLR
ncbi:MAG: hypothetical protein KF830_00490 [Planctomycetes bacterium]|nr:hypothetical protein [Planctomycetota bacterium]